MSEHADPEALSAYVDGEAPEWADHVAACAECTASAERLRAVAVAVAAPVDPPTAAVRDAAIAAALDGGGARPAAVPARPGRRPTAAGWMLGAAAALFLVVVGVAALLGSSGRSSGNRTTAAGPAAGSAAGPLADTASPTAPVTDLGDVPDAATLLARTRPALDPKVAVPAPGGTSSASNSGAASAGPPSGGTGGAAQAPLPLAAGGTSSQSSATGVRPCEQQARARQPSLGPVVYFATARHQGVPAVVLGFSTGSDPAQVTLLVLAQDGCGELLRAVGP